MKKKLFLLFLLLSLAANAQIINIPDANFKAYLLSSSSSNTIAKNFGGNYFAIDANGDGEIQQSEADQVEGLEIDDTSPGPIENYEGISSFSNVKSIGINSFVAPTTPLTISNLNFLENLFVNFHDILGSIDIVNNPQLKNIMISGITLNTLSNNPLIENLIIYSESGSSISANAMGGIEGLSNLKNLELNGFYNMISSLPINLSGHNNLLSLKIFHTSLDNVDVSGCSVLHDITLDSSYLNLTAAININSSNCPNLTNYSVAQNGNVSANIISDNCPGLINFISTDYGEVSLSLNGCTNLELINVRNLGSLSVNNCINLNKIKALRFRGSSLDLSNNNLQNLKYIEIDFNPINGSGPGPLTFLNVQGITSLLELRCFYHQISNLNVQGCTQLKYLDCSQNQLAALNVQGLNNLERLECSENQLNSLDVHNLASLKWLNSYACGLVTLNAQNCPNLEYLHCAENQLTSLNVQGCNNLETLACLHNQLTSLDVSGLSKLQLLSCGFNQLTSLDLRDCINLQEFWCDNNQLTTLFMKNGSNEPLGFGFSNNPALQYICCDDTQMNEVQNIVTSNGMTNCNVNTYCSFVPGGNYNTITGAVRFDENNNGCDISDEFFEHMKLKINDGTSTGETFVKNNGKYDFYTQAGSFMVTAEPENPALFTVVPSTFTTSFPDNNNNIFTQNICVTKNGNANDLEVVIAPETNATPGFNAKYKLMWRNKGNTTLSGNVIFTFNSSKMNFISSTLPYASIAGNQITFNFSNLKPYGNTATELVFNINTPTHPTNPVNSGDILNFSAVVNPLAGDIKPEDNSFSYKQTVVNSLDPNDIVCIEGNSIPQSMVGKYLHYIVNFENTGTAPATNIVVEMDIDPTDFDISTLQLQNASHQVYTRIKDNKVEFIMKYANLGNGGHGNVLMKMLSKNTLVSGDNVNNKANIYFDYNFPVVTNDAVTTIENGSVLHTAEAKTDDSVTVYPIPTKGEVNIKADSKITSVEVYDAQGRIIQRQIGINSQNTKLTIHSDSSGVFLFKVNTEKEILMKKVIKN